MTGLIKKLFILSVFVLLGCNNMIDGVNKSDTQKINTVKSKNYSLGSPKNLELNILKKRLTKIR